MWFLETNSSSEENGEDNYPAHLFRVVTFQSVAVAFHWKRHQEF